MRYSCTTRHSVRSADEIARKQDGARLFADISAVDINTREKKKEKTVPRNGYGRSSGRCDDRCDTRHPIGGCVDVATRRGKRRRTLSVSRHHRARRRDPPRSKAERNPSRRFVFPFFSLSLSFSFSLSLSLSPSPSPPFSLSLSLPRLVANPEDRNCEPVAHLRNARSATVPPAGRRIGGATCRERRVRRNREEKKREKTKEKQEEEEEEEEEEETTSCTDSETRWSCVLVGISLAER